MLTDPDDRAARGLRRYLKRVADALGLTGDPYTVDLDPPMSAYLALDGRLPGRPDRDLALLWQADQGWALAIETACGEDLIIVRWLGGDVLPAPRIAARFVEDALAGYSPGQTQPPEVPNDTDLTERLAAYASYAPGPRRAWTGCSRGSAPIPANSRRSATETAWSATTRS